MQVTAATAPFTRIVVPAQRMPMVSCLLEFLCSLTALQGVLAAGSNTVTGHMSTAIPFSGTLFMAACL